MSRSNLLGNSRKEEGRSGYCHIPHSLHHEGAAEQRKNKKFADFFQGKKKYIWILLIIFSYVASDLFEEYAYYFRASLVQLTPTEFIGTEFPIKKVPNWVVLSDRERKMAYAQLPKSKLINIPPYRLSDLKKGKNWNTSTKSQRNAYITYPVPNLGNYMLDGSENSGSHTGVDIKVPVGTPVYAIASGVVYRTDYQKTGFGKYISIAHVGIPDPDNSGKKTTLFSNYAHLSQIDVKEGREIKAGQIIGKTGETGFATTPHLHFQIDRDTAPFHPYWPFQWKDVKAAGLNSYFEAVKRGIGMGNARKHTSHPMDFVAEFNNYIAPNLVASTIPVITSIESHKEPEVITSPKIQDSNFKPQASKSNSAPLPTDPRKIKLASSKNSTVRQKSRSGRFEVEFDTDRGFIPGEEKIVNVRINDANLVASAGIEISSTARRSTDVVPRKLFKDDFKNGVARVMVKSDSTNRFKLVAKGDFGEVKSQSFSPQIFKDVSGSHTYGPAIKYLKENKIIKGYTDGTFRPDATINRAEAVKILLTGNRIPVGKGATSFPDVPSTAWFSDYVSTAADWGIVKGYADGKFRPGNTISRAEFLKVAILTAGFTPSDIIRTPYQDVPLEAWFAKYFQFCKEHELLRLKKGGFIVPNTPITRSEAADVIYRLERMK